MVRSCLFLLTAFFLVLAVKAQDGKVLIQIKLIDGRTGNPMKNQPVGLEDGFNYHEISARTDEFGVASISVSKNAVILTHNTDGYVNCGDERGGLIHNDFKTNQILSTGIVQPIEQPNLCKMTSGVAKPGQLILFVRPWKLWEKI
jgi:hypothetical protein